MLVRLCDVSDWPRMCRLRLGRRTHAGAPVDTFSSVAIGTIHPRYLSAPNIAVGCWVDDKLEAFICASGYPEFWVLDLMISNGDPKYLRACLEYCLQHYESHGVAQFYYAFPQKWARAYRSFWREGAESLRKYTIEDCKVIEPYAIPDDFVWEHILHQIVVPVPFLLRRSYVQ